MLVRRLGIVALAASLLVAIAPAAASSSGPGAAPTIEVLSNRADLISGGDALVAVVPPAGQATVPVTLNGTDISASFAVRPNGRYEGLVSGLRLGANTLIAGTAGGPRSAITITNHPIGGPVFAGPQVQPWTCTNKAKTDAQCDQAPTFAYEYFSSKQQGFEPYDPAHPASDVAQITTQTGSTVPFVIRIETGYEDRDQYQIAALYQPGVVWAPWDSQPQFNHKLVITHGASCDVAYQSGGAPSVTSDMISLGVPLIDNAGGLNAVPTALGLGFAVLSTALDNNGHNCNIATQAESLVMAKEQFTESYGEIEYTIGMGCSGGSLTEQQVANAYPGIYQGILPTCSFPDTWSSGTQVMDYHLLRDYFEHPSTWGSGVVWSPTQWGPVEGNLLPVDAIVSDVGFFNAIVPTHSCGGTTAQTRYNPVTNPGGVRCSIADYMINVLGPQPQDRWSANERKLGHGFAGVPVDNVGVQYGLDALIGGEISPAQFVDLNAKIGGLDIDINPTAARINADEPALANAYRSGAINENTNSDQVAIIDLRGPDPGLAHDAYRAFAVRARLDAAHGGHANQIIWEGPVAIIGDSASMKQALLAMDRWLAAVSHDHRALPVNAKLALDKPADIGDRCSDGIGQVLLHQLCPPAVVPVYGTPRTVAGQPITTDENKCQLKPLNRADYPVVFTAAQWASLEHTFPTGVCDFTKPGVSQQPTIPWQTYQDSTGRVIYGGRALPPPPVSHRV